MANALRGEVDLKAGGKTYKLRLGTNEIIEAENLLDTGIMELAVSLAEGKARASMIRALLWAALRRHHPDISILDAGEIVNKASLAKASEAIGHAIQAAFPAAEGAENPQTASPGNG